MSSVVISGDTSGAITLSAPSVAGTNTITLPANTGTVITTASSGGVIPSGALPAGSVLQVVQGSTNAATTVTSGSYTSTSLAATITPKFATSKILILITASCYIAKGSNSDAGCGIGIYRNGSQVFADAGLYYNFYYGSTVTNIRNRTPLNYLDSPTSTSALTYTFYIANYPSSGSTASLNTDNQYSFITLMEIAA